ERQGDQPGESGAPDGRHVPVWSRENRADQGRREAAYPLVRGRLRTPGCDGLQPDRQTTVPAVGRTECDHEKPPLVGGGGWLERVPHERPFLRRLEFVRCGTGDLARPRRASQLRDSAGFAPASL